MPLEAVSVAVFAYNEEDRIVACLDALRACAREADLSVYVLINGCTDKTEQIVRDYSGKEINLQPIVIPEGDKANAWNYYTHEVAPAAAHMHIFTDGDVVIGEGSVSGFISAFANDQYAMGCAGLPSSGRSQSSFRSKLINNREMAGNLYAIRGECLRKFRQRAVRLPFGIFGEDGLVTTLIKWNLDMRGSRDDLRVTNSPEATFSYKPLYPFSIKDLNIYRKRKMRYAVRQQQANMLYPLLFEGGIEAMPVHVLDLYRARSEALRLRWNGINTWFDWIACRRIRRDVVADDSVRQDSRAHLYS